MHSRSAENNPAYLCAANQLTKDFLEERRIAALTAFASAREAFNLWHAAASHYAEGVLCFGEYATVLYTAAPKVDAYRELFPISLDCLIAPQGAVIRKIWNDAYRNGPLDVGTTILLTEDPEQGWKPFERATLGMAGFGYHRKLVSLGEARSIASPVSEKIRRDEQLIKAALT